MGRHSLPDAPRARATGSRMAPLAAHRRAVVFASALALLVGAGTAVATHRDWLPFAKDCEGQRVPLAVAASPEIAPVLRTAVERAQEDGVRSDGNCMAITIKERTGADMAERLRRGGKDGEFQVWLPESALWLRRAADSGTPPPMETIGNVALSPVALGAVPAAAKRLGWPGKTHTWSAVAEAAAAEKNPRLGMADPQRSATGLLALAHMADSIAREGGKDTETRTAATAKQLSQRIAPGDAQLAATLPHDGSGAELANPQRNQLLVLSEQAAYAHNTAENDAPQLRLFYPKDGGAQLDYPYTLLDQDQLTQDQIRAASRFLTLLGDDEGRSTLHQHGFRSAIGPTDQELVRTAGGRAPQPYSAAPAEPPKPAELETVLGVWTIIVRSERLTTVVDSSGSMDQAVPGQDGRSRMDVVKAALLQALTHFTPEDEIGLWEFARQLDGKRDYRTLVPAARLGGRTDGGKTQMQELTAALSTLKPVKGGATGLYDTALAVYEDALESYADDKFNVLVMLTDGSNQDPGSISRGELVKKLKKLSGGERELPLIAIAIGDDADLAVCQDIAEATGGAAYEVSDPGEIYEVIFKAIVTAAKGDS